MGLDFNDDSCRENGADGDLKVKWKTIDKTAVSGKDFTGGEGELEFKHGETQRTINIPIIDDMDVEKDENFEVELYEVDNGGKLGKITKTAVTITNDDEFNTIMNKMMMMTNTNVDKLRVHNETWAQQIKDAPEQDKMEPQTQSNSLVSPVRESQIVNGSSSKSTMNRPPIPGGEELERRFNEVLIQMDLPPERLKILKSFPNEKKWATVCDFDLVQTRDPSSVYLTKLRTYLDPKAYKSSKKIRNLDGATSTQVLRNLEISLRNNQIEWVRDFLSEESKGLDVLIDYLKSRLEVMTTRHLLQVDEEEATGSDGGSLGSKLWNVSMGRSRKNSDLRRVELRKLTKRDKDRKLGDENDDVHVCLLCLKAIMNNKFGFNMVIKNKQAINLIALCLIHKNLLTKTIVLELLAATCLLKGGHNLILSAFDNFKQVGVIEIESSP